jgi:hypothetical protein
MDINVSDEEIDVDKMNKKCDVELKTDEKSISTSPKPGVSYIALISMAIQSSPMKKMLLSEIYNFNDKLCRILFLQLRSSIL